MAVTISEVARRAGVSTATVSRVINGAGNVDTTLKDNVLAAMKELGYIPNTLAQSLRQNRSKTIGITTSDLSVGFFPRIIRELERVFQPLGYATLVTSTYDIPERERNFLQLLMSRRVDALVACSTCQNEDALRAISESGTPVILYDRRSRSLQLPSVYVDKRRSMAVSLDHLSHAGHRRVALITGPRTLSTNYDRYMGFQKYAFDHDIDPNDFSFHFGGFSPEFGMQAIEEIMSQPDRPTAVVTGSVAITAGIMMYCKAHGLSIPGDLALVSSGTFNYPSVVEPSLTYLDDMVDLIAAKIIEKLGAALDAGELADTSAHDNSGYAVDGESIAIEPRLNIGSSS